MEVKTAENDAANNLEFPEADPPKPKPVKPKKVRECKMSSENYKNDVDTCKFFPQS